MALEKTFNAAEAESRIYADWETKGAFKAGANAQRDEHFSVMIPPPNVTGSLHMGHAFNNTLQDILVRWHRMQGFDTLWQPGQDHAGIATQMVVERELAATGQPGRRELGREAFTAKVWEQKQKSGGTIIDQLRRLGASCDWSRNAFTMSGAPGAPEGEEGNFHDAVIKVFVDMYNKGLIYRGKRLVNWDPHFETAISDLEVESTEVDGHMWHFKYPLAGGETYTYVEKDEDGNTLFEETRDYISIATTRPETMLGDGAVAVHPSDERYASIVGKLCEIPVGPKEQRRLIPIITDEYPDKNFGSGAVKITGAHDFNDYGVAKRNGIPLYALMETQGRMRADGLPYDQAAARAQAIADGSEAAPEDATEINLVPDAYRGLDRFEARKRVVEDVTAEGLAVMTEATDPRLGRAAKKAPVEPGEGGEMRTEEENLVPLVEAKKIMQPFGDRSKVVIEPMLTDQWFVATDKIVQPAIDAVRSGEVTILPEQDRKVYFHWLENIEPWCISRQLWWGHQIPVWYGPKKKDGSYDYRESETFCASSEAEAAKLAQSFYGEHVTIGVEPESTREPYDPNSVVVELRRDPDVLDTWFSSGLWPIGTLGWPEQTAELEKYFPTSVLVTGFDIIFFWVARMMMTGLHFMGKEPFSDVYIHALVRDEKGAKMSKTKGNVIDPIVLIDEYGADALRFTLAAMAAQGRDIKLATARVEGYRNFATKLWNAARFAEHYECKRVEGFDPTNAKETLNRWIATETTRAATAVTGAIEAYRFNDAAAALYRFTWNLYCDWYLEFSKPVLNGEDGPAKTETRATVAWVLDRIISLLHPFMPFLTEELWAREGDEGRTALMLNAWPELGFEDSDAADEINWLIETISAVRSVRSEMNVPAGAMIELAVSGAAFTTAARLQSHNVLIRRLARAESLTLAHAPRAGALQIVVGEATFSMPLEGVIDIDAERARLEREIDKIAKDVGKIEAKLANEKFMAKAPEEVIEEQRERLAEAAALKAKTEAALARLEPAA
ncbi:MAG: valine--tRNA ligase [Sulfitobacter sp.]|uniref:valine--tRNA ligase n=1 Tax=Sulfitobacter sp. TaxID=1903071 RepID=UPI00329729FD